MRIISKPKRVSTIHPSLSQLIQSITSSKTDDLAEILSKIDVWKWPRSDLNSWIGVLNHLDSVLESIITEYDIDKSQLRPFSPQSKVQLSEILRFERLLLENSTNRKLYNSYDRINSLLFTSDLDVLILTLNLLLRPSVQYSAQPAVAHALHISTTRLHSLSRRWNILGESNLELSDLVDSSKKACVEILSPDSSSVQMTFYRRAPPETRDDKSIREADASAEGTVPKDTSEPTPGAEVSARRVSVQLGPLVASSRDSMNILADAVSSHDIPQEEQFELLCRIRVARSLSPSRFEERVKIATVRLLAIAIYVHTHTESQTQTALLVYEPDLVSHIAELLQQDRDVPRGVQTAALAAIDALARHRSRFQDVLVALNAGVNHGVLMSLFRRTIFDLQSEENTTPLSFAEAVLSLVAYIATQSTGGTMVVGAGLVPLLIQILNMKQTSRLSFVSKAMQLIDNILYGFPNAFQIFCLSGGIDALVARIHHEVDLNLAIIPDKCRIMAPSLYGYLSFPRMAILKHLLRSIHRVMQSSGTAEGLRGLIDSALPRIIKTIIGHRNYFGPTVLPLAIDIMSTFIHNEPTSLTTVQELGLPEVFYAALDNGLESTIEVIKNVTTAIGALCLNQPGQDQLAARPTIVPGLLNILISDNHLKVLQDKENAAVVGSAIDELIRHHPFLRSSVLESIEAILTKIEATSASRIADIRDIGRYRLQAVRFATDPPNEGFDDVTMMDIDTQTVRMTTGNEVGIDADNVEKEGDRVVVTYIDIMGRFLEGFFQHTPHCRDFITKHNGVERIGCLAGLACLPYDFATCAQSDSLVQVMRTMSEVAPNQALSRWMKLVRESLDDTSFFWQEPSAEAKLQSYLDELDGDGLDHANNQFLSLVRLHMRVTLLSDVYSTAGYSHGRASSFLLQVLTNNDTPNILRDLGALHRSCIWENIVLRSALDARGIKLDEDRTLINAMHLDGPNEDSSMSDAIPQRPTQDVVGAGESANAELGDTESRLQSSHGSRIANAKALKFIVIQIPGALTPFFQAVVKMLWTGRRQDDSQILQVRGTAECLTEILQNHMSWWESSQFLSIIRCIVPLSTQSSTGKLLASYAYSTVVAGLVTVLLLDERPAQSNLHTILAAAFWKKGGLEEFLRLGDRYAETVTRTIQTIERERTSEENEEFAHAIGGLKVVLHLLHALSSVKPLFEAQQTASITTKELDYSHVNYFEPHDFLVKLRATMLPFVQKLWSSGWLREAPISIIKSVLQIVLVIAAAEHEEPRSGDATDGINGIMGARVISMPPTGPDENRIRQLMDMGFPRTAAERALMRTHNNVSAATEYLLTHPWHVQEAPRPPEQLAEPLETDTEAVTSSGTPVDASTNAVDPLAANSTSPQTVKTRKEWLSELRSMRDPLSSDLISRSLEFVDRHPSLIFDLRPAFTISAKSYTDALHLLVNDIKELSPLAYSEKEQHLSIRCQALAVLLHDNASSTPLTDYIDTNGVMRVLLALLLSSPSHTDEGMPKSPLWLASHLLIIEALLIAGEQPRLISLPGEDEAIREESLFTGPTFSDSRPVIFDYCLRLLSHKSLTRDEALSALRILLCLTRDRSLADEFVKRDGLSAILSLLNDYSTARMNDYHSYIIIIMRHISEDASSVRSIITHEVKRWCNQLRSQSTTATGLMRGIGHIILRDPALFLKSAQEVLKMNDQQIQPIDPSDSQARDGNGINMAVDAKHGINGSTQETTELMVGHLTQELMKVAKTAVQDASQATGSSVRSNAVVDASENSAELGQSNAPESNENGPNNQDGQVLYAHFILQALTELLLSYNSCKTAFLAYTRKKTQPASKDVAPKFRNVALNFVLTDIVCAGSFESRATGDSQKTNLLSNDAVSLVVALCITPPSMHDYKLQSSDLSTLRKHALEAISRAIKDALAIATPDIRYRRLFALSDLCYRLLSVKTVQGSRSVEDTVAHLAKIMLEKNFVSILTSILTDVDLKYPNIKALVSSVLRPLELLTKLAKTLSKPSDKTIASQNDNSDSASSEEAQEDDRESVREDTPDLYRNSALGMYGGDIEEFGQDEEMGEGNVEDDVEMEYAEEDNGSEDTSADEEEEEAGAENLENFDGSEDEDSSEEEMEEGWQGGDGDEDEETLPENPEEEAIWEITTGDAGGQDVMEETDENDPQVDDADGNAFAEEEDGAEYVDEEDDIVQDINLPGIDLSEEDALGRLTVQLTRSNRHIVEEHGMSPGDLSLAAQLFGRAAEPPPQAHESMRHPLLTESSDASLTGRSSTAQVRRSQRAMGGPSEHLLQTIQEIVSGGGVQVIQQLIGRSGRPGQEAYRLVPPAHLVSELDMGLPHRHRHIRVTHGHRGDRSQREGSLDVGDFAPHPTPQRWAEESKALFGKQLPERCRLLENHLMLALLPKAREAALAAKQEQEREAEKQKEEEAEKQKEEEAERQKEEREAEQQKEQQSSSAPPSNTVETSDSSELPTLHDIENHHQGNEDVHMAEPARNEGVIDSSEPTESANEVSSTTHVVSVDAEAGPVVEPTAEGSSSAAQANERVTVLIHGTSVDITDTGIDPTFLDALPDDMREEVLNQHFRDRRPAREQRPQDSQISSEFLNALPPEIRDEILQQERLDQSRTSQQQAPATSGAGPVDMDPASFLASLDPQLRSVVLLDQEEHFLHTLPSAMLAEASLLRDGSAVRANVRRIEVPNPNAGASSSTVERKSGQKEALFLLDKNSVSVLVRLLFYPDLLRKNTLHKTLVNLCENSKTRSDVFSLLLNILQDCTGDLASVDRSFSEMSFRPLKGQGSARASSNKSLVEASNITSIPHLANDTKPDLIGQRCLEALTFIVSSNETSSLFFLTEHELPSATRKSTSKKGKGKEKSASQTCYPVVLLLNLLDKPHFLRTAAVMDSLAGLLANVTRPLLGLPIIEPSIEVPVQSRTSGPAPDEAGSGVDAPTEENRETVQTSQNPSDEQSSDQSTSKPVEDHDPSQENKLLQKAPQIPHFSLRLVVNILLAGECSSRTFQQTLALIQHLATIPDARDIISQELCLKAQDLGFSLRSDLAVLAASLGELLGDNLNDSLISGAGSRFTPASSDQAKLLRILKTIDYMFSARPNRQGTNFEGNVSKLHDIYGKFDFTLMWTKLGQCLSIVEDKSDLEHLATILLPLIESLMVVCKHVGIKRPGNSDMLDTRTSFTPSEPLNDLFITFTEAHRKILNVMVRNNPSLMSGSFSLLVNNPRVLDFDNKRNYFNQQLRRRPHGREHHGTLQLNIRRQRVFEDSFQYLQRKTGDQIKWGKLSVRFYEEEGVDAGGVTREWFSILARQMFNPDYALFQPCAADKLTYQPNRASSVNPEHLSFFRFVGRVIGKAIFDGRLLEAYFARSVYRQLLGKPVDYRDVEWVDPEYYNSLCWILENDPSPLELTFDVEDEEFGTTRLVSLKENGSSIAVTEENKKEFVQLSAQYRLVSSIKEQITAILEGFYEIIPKDLITIFNEKELELLISGTPDIDVDEWRAATDYNGYNSSDPVIVWWWRALKSFGRDERAKVLSFATGTSRVPLNGFTDLQGVQGTQRFSIHRAYGEADRLPQAHTCFNQIDLPHYSSYDQLRARLLLAINEGSEGFGFA